MASGDSIQIDNGEFVRVHNAIFDLLAKAPLRGQQFRCLMFLFRKTYGYNKKEDTISLAQWADGTGLRRQNVWRELQLLIKCNVIYMKSSGPKRPNTWGFNKRHEQWNFESVITDDYTTVITDDDTSVITEDYSNEPSVITSDDKSVITPHEHTKDNKDSSKAAMPIWDEENQASSLVLLAYNTVGKIAPSQFRDDGKANLVIACELIDKYGWEGCVRGISTLKERNNARVLKNARDSIRSPVSYLRTLLESAEPSLPPTVEVLDFSIGELA